MKKDIKFNKKSAFTLIEITLVIVIMSVLILFTVNSLFGSEKTKLTKISSFTSSFYHNISNTYQGIVMQNTRNYNLANLADKNGDNNVDSVDLAQYFAEMMGGELLLSEEETEPEPTPDSGEEEDPTALVTQNSSCKNLAIQVGSPIAQYAQNATCVDFNKIIAGFVYDRTCSLSINVKEYLTKDDVDSYDRNSSYDAPQRSVSNNCGYIVYGMKDGSGKFKRDLFTIPLGKGGVK